MNFPFYIAKRYLFSIKTKNAVNVITAISVIGVAVGTMALVVVLSVFNGFESLIKSMYHPIHSDFVVQAVHGKSFSSLDYSFGALSDIAPWESIQQVYEEKVLLRLDDREHIGKLRGQSEWPEEVPLSIEEYIFDGRSYRDFHEGNRAIIGQSLAYTISASSEQFSKPIRVFVPNVKAKPGSFNQQPFLERSFFVAGIFSVQAEYDASYVITSLKEVQDFLDKEGALTSLEFNLKDDNIDGVQGQLQQFFGPEYIVKNRRQQQGFLFKVLETEKWAIFFILSFILLIATFNIVASVVMIVLEKRKDISSLWAMGASQRSIQQIFFYEGLLITFLGGGIGLLFGFLLCFLQQYFELIKIGSAGSFIISAYPVEIQMFDIVLVFATVIFIGACITYLPVRFLKNKFIQAS